MKFKNLFLIICLVICLFTMAGVCAGELNDTAITATDFQENLKIIEDHQIIDNKCPVGAEDSTNCSAIDNPSVEPQDDNMEIPAQETYENSDKLGITDDDYLSTDLNANVIALNVSVLDNALFVVDCSDDFNGNVLITVGGDEIYDGSVNVLIEAAKLPAGNYTASALFYGDDKYANLTLNDIMFSVSRVTPSIDANIEDLTYPNIAQATIHIGNNANGTVNVTVGDRTYGGIVHNGDAYVPISGLSAGYKAAKIEFFSSDYYNSNVNASTKFIVYPNNSLIEIRKDKDVWQVGEDIFLYVYTKNSTGDLTVYVNGASYGEPLHYEPGRSYEVILSNKLEGTYVVDFHLDGDENFTGYDTYVTIYVVKNDLSINVTDVYDVIRVGSPIIISAKLNNTVTGNVTFTINGANYTEFVDNCDEVTHAYTPVNNDTLTVIATFMGNDIYNAKQSCSKEFNVTRIATTIDVDFVSSIIAGDDAQISVFMNPDITCTARLIVGSKFYDVAIVEGSGIYSVTNLADDTYDIQAVYFGDDRYADTASDIKQLVVNKAITNLNISIDKTSMSYYDFAVVSITLNQSINAVVTVKVNGQNNTVGLVNGKGSFKLYDLDKGNYIINAVFAGDDRYVGSTSNTLNLTVTGDNISSSVSISLNRDSVMVGEEVVITVTSNPTVTGVIRLKIGSNYYNVAVKRGTGFFTISDLANGTYDVQAVFDGDNKHSGSSSDVKHLEVKKIPTKLSIVMDNSTLFIGDSVVVSVVLNQAITNVATVNVNGENYLIGIVNGKGKLTLNALTFGTYTVNATFAGDGKYAGSISDNVTFEVNKIETQLVGSAITVTYNDDKYLVVTLKDSKGNAIVNAKLDVDLNGVKTFTTDDKGQVKVSTSSLIPEVYSAKVTFDGNAIYDKSSTAVMVTVKKATPKIYAKAMTFKAKVKTKKYSITLKDNKGKAIKNANVILKVNGKPYKATTNSKGKATFKIVKLNKKGTYKATVTYNGYKLYNKKTFSTKITVK